MIPRETLDLYADELLDQSSLGTVLESLAAAARRRAAKYRNDTLGKHRAKQWRKYAGQVDRLAEGIGL